MEKHLMITVSEDKSSLYAARFTGHFFSDKKNMRITLFHSAPPPPALWDNERNLQANIQQEEQRQIIRARIQKSLKHAKDECLSMGFHSENINTKLQDRVYSKVNDIIQEGEKGLYDAVVLGRRGLSMLEKLFDESVSDEMFQQTFTFPLWLCRSVDPNRRNILLYVDGSETSYRMADHVGFILTGERRHRVTLLVMDKPEQANDILNKATSLLIDNDFPPDLIHRQPVHTEENLAKLLMDEADKKGYAAVALGRSGGENNLLKRIFKGDVCYTIFKEIDGAALWVCH